MKILIANMMAPFVWGGAEELAVHLNKHLQQAGHQSEILRIPFQWEPAACIPSQMMMVKAFEIKNVDRVIALKFPAYLINHPHKTLWLLHQYRQAYDLLDAGQSNIPQSPTGDALISLIRNADAQTFSECRQVYTISEVTRQRMLKYNNFNANVLIPPMNDPELFTGGKMGDYIFAGGRINSLKRQFKLIEALPYADKRVNLVIAGPPECPADAQCLRDLVSQLGVEDRVTLDLRFLTRLEYAGYVNNAAAVAYIPFDEDSLGYVTMEAATAGKPIITLTDSGGVLGLVDHGVTGWIANPDNQSLANAMSMVWDNVSVTAQCGRAARELLLSLKINWANTIEALLE